MVPHLDTPTPLDLLPEFFSSVHAHTSHATQPPNFPVVLPPEFEAKEYSDVSAQWNPSVQLQMEVLKYVVDVDFKKVPITSLSEKQGEGSLPWVGIHNLIPPSLSRGCQGQYVATLAYVILHVSRTSRQSPSGFYP